MALGLKWLLNGLMEIDQRLQGNTLERRTINRKFIQNGLIHSLVAASSWPRDSLLSHDSKLDSGT